MATTQCGDPDPWWLPPWLLSEMRPSGGKDKDGSPSPACAAPASGGCSGACRMFLNASVNDVQHALRVEASARCIRTQPSTIHSGHSMSCTTLHVNAYIR